MNEWTWIDTFWFLSTGYKLIYILKCHEYLMNECVLPFFFRLNLSSDNTSTVRQDSSSDEGETLADEANDLMDIDNLDR